VQGDFLEAEAAYLDFPAGNLGLGKDVGADSNELIPYQSQDGETDRLDDSTTRSLAQIK
jgi:hypothetical protein